MRPLFVGGSLGEGGDMRLIVLFMCLFIISGCATALPKIQSYQLPDSYKTEINETLAKVNSLPLQNKYTVEIITGQTISRQEDYKLAYIKNTTIYIDDFFFKYIYYDQSIHPRLKRPPNINNYICLIAHEIAHQESGLGNTPLETHLQVDHIAIDYCKQLGLSKKDYFLFLWLLDSTIQARTKSSVGYVLEGLNMLSVVGTGISFPYSEFDAFKRAIIIFQESEKESKRKKHWWEY